MSRRRQYSGHVVDDEDVSRRGKGWNESNACDEVSESVARRCDDFGFWGHFARPTINIAKTWAPHSSDCPNNCGKSIVYRALRLAITTLRECSRVTYTESKTVTMEPDAIWRQDASHPIVIELTLTAPYSGFGYFQGEKLRLTLNDEWKMRLTLQSQPTLIQARATVSPMVYVSNENRWTPLFEDNGLKPRVMSPTGHHEDSDGSNMQGYWSDELRHATGALKEWLASCRLFHPFRTFYDATGAAHPIPTIANPPGDYPLIEDGHTLIRRILYLQNAKNKSGDFARFKGRILKRLNAILDHRYSGFEVKPDPLPSIYLSLDSPDAVPLSIDSMGSGVAQLVLILSTLELDAGATKDRRWLYVIEEPELHLHPRILRRFMQQLAEFTNVTFILSSHSSVILDNLADEDVVYQFRQHVDGHCLAECCPDIVSRHALLDALGLSGSTLLQANCVIWVEGPSDRLFLRQWLCDYAKANSQKPLVEGADYSFAFFGGATLAHFDFALDDDNIDELIAMISISRFSVVMMDRDLPPTDDDSKLDAKKVRIVGSAQADSGHRMAIISTGRDVENDIDEGVFRLALAEVIGLDVAELDHFRLTGQKKFVEEVTEFVKHRRPKRVSGLDKRITLAKKIIEKAEKSGGMGERPKYIEALYRFIEGSRVA
jgi:predicted ATPase